MPVTKATPYLFFNHGHAEEALELYRSALGATVSNVARYGDMPEDSGMCAPEHKNRIMNAAFRVGSAEFMCSDRTDDKGPGVGDVQITLHFDDADEMARCFDKLAESGEVNMPIHDAFWGDQFGALKDKFGIGWQFIKPGKP